MLFGVLGYCCCVIVFFLSGLLAFPLLRQGRKISFLGLLLGIQFVINALCSPLVARTIFKMGEEYLVNHKVEHCNEFYLFLVTSYTINFIPNCCILFCRFIYARYAHGLLIDNGRLFQKLVLVAISMFSIHMVTIWLTTMVKEQGIPDDSARVKMCDYIPASETKGELDFDFFKTWLFTSVFGFIWLFFITYFDIISHKQTLYYSIPRTRQNILSLKEHVVWVKATLISHLFTQLVVDGSLQMFGKNLGEENVFLMWWISQFLRFICVFMISPCIILAVALRNYPEFLGYQAKVFPGQEKPRKIRVEADNLVHRTDENLPLPNRIRVISAVKHHELSTRNHVSIEMPVVDIH